MTTKYTKIQAEVPRYENLTQNQLAKYITRYSQMGATGVNIARDVIVQGFYNTSWGHAKPTREIINNWTRRSESYVSSGIEQMQSSGEWIVSRGYSSGNGMANVYYPILPAWAVAEMNEGRTSKLVKLTWVTVSITEDRMAGFDRSSVTDESLTAPAVYVNPANLKKIAARLRERLAAENAGSPETTIVEHAPEVVPEQQAKPSATSEAVLEDGDPSADDEAFMSEMFADLDASGELPSSAYAVTDVDSETSDISRSVASPVTVVEQGDADEDEAYTAVLDALPRDLAQQLQHAPDEKRAQLTRAAHRLVDNGFSIRRTIKTALSNQKDRDIKWIAGWLMTAFETTPKAESSVNHGAFGNMDGEEEKIDYGVSGQEF